MFAAPMAAFAQSADTKPAAGDAKPATEVKRARVTFLDSKLFDGQLSKELDAGNDAVEIDFLGKVSLNNIPQRIDRWISIVGEKGAVNIKPAEQALKPKFLFDIVELIYTGVQRSNEEKMLDPVRQYDAVIFYALDASGEPRIDKIVFSRRKQISAKPD
jgi:hypothetical protein